MIFIPHVSRRKLLDILHTTLTDSSGYDSQVTYHLFKADIADDLDNVLSDYDTNEADYSGYGAIGVTDFSIAATSSGITYILASGLLYQHNGGGTANDIYGYYVTNSDDSELLWVERFPVEKTMDTIASIIQLVPRLVLEHIIP